MPQPVRLPPHLLEAVQWLDRVTGQAASRSLEDRVDQTLCEATVARDVLAADELRFLAKNGHRITLNVEEAGWQATVTLAGPGAPTIEAEDNLTDAFDKRAVEAQTAIRSNNLEAFLELCTDFSFRLRASITNDPRVSRCHWIRTRQGLERRLNDALIHTIISLAGGDAVGVVIVGDMGEAYLDAPSLQIGGPERPDPDEPLQGSTALADDYRRAWLNDWREVLPAPTDIHPLVAHGAVVDLERCMRAVARLVAILWLAPAAERDRAAVRVSVAAHSEAVPLLLEQEPPDSEDVIALWRWATASSDPVRREAVSRALAGALQSGQDPRVCAELVRRNADELLRLSQQDLLAEVISARRVARAAAEQAARDLGAATRDAVRKSVDRTVLQLAAGVGIFLAHGADIFDRTSALALFAVALVVFGASVAAVLAVDVSSANAAVNAFERDLELSPPDALSQSDVQGLQQLRVLVDAKRQLKRGRWAVWTIGAVGAVALVALAVLVASMQGPSPNGADRGPDPDSLVDDVDDSEP